MDVHGRQGSTSTPHGVKRRAEDNLKDDQRLARRLKLLHIEQNGKVRIPGSSSQQTPRRPNSSHENGNGSMQLDDTKDKIYIHDLDDQIAEIEDEEKMLFLPDIEKKLAQIPQYLLTGNLRPTAENQMVLYGVPASLSVPEEKDNVRKAIIESRARAREKQLLDDEAASIAIDPVRNGVTHIMGYHGGETAQRPQSVEDEDAMDLG